MKPVVLLTTVRHNVEMSLLLQEVDAATAESAGGSTVEARRLFLSCCVKKKALPDAWLSGSAYYSNMEGRW